MSDLSDVQLKMSKKIAQLTKVIFHLHTKNEENKSFKQAISNANEKEINLILEQCNRMVNQYKDALEKQQAGGNLVQKMKELETKHSKEKESSVADFEEYKRKTSQRENEINMMHQDKVENMKMDLSELKGRFEDRVEELKT